MQRNFRIRILSGIARSFVFRKGTPSDREQCPDLRSQNGSRLGLNDIPAIVNCIFGRFRMRDPPQMGFLQVHIDNTAAEL